MANVAVKKSTSPNKETLRVFAELSKRFDEIQRRAFEYFEKRGRTAGNEWFQ